ncbi:MAG: DUF4292 domain-containing protein [Bacteroidetes bacterium]|nr:DUF4292 domain-containing protein [Bacteroidota bacterium]
MSNCYGRIPVILFVVVVAIMTGLSSCKTRHKAQVPVVKDEKNPDDKSAPDLQQLIYDNSFKVNSFSAKASVKTNIGDQSNSFNINLRIKTDSVIWISVSPLLGIEVARVMITRDSVKFMDRLNNKYSNSDFRFFNDLLNVNIDFEIIQGILTGNLFSYKKNKFNSVYIEDKYYILSTLSKRKLKRSLEDIDPNKPIVQDMWVSYQNYRITRLSVEDQRLQKSLLTDYSDHRQTEGGLFPFFQKQL